MIKAILCSFFILIWNQSNYCELPEVSKEKNTEIVILEKEEDKNNDEINIAESWSILENTDLLSDSKKELIEEKVTHIKTPEKVKSVYYTAYSAWSKSKMDNLYYLIDNTEINSVTIDIKTVSWYVSFEMDSEKFWKIKPISDWRIQDVKKLIEDLHNKWIYVIARVVVFKDKLLASNRPDLAVKRIDNWEVWTDYKWLKYLDPSSKEVWDYNAEIASQAYELWFDEINFDYVRFPTDGRISNAYYSHSSNIISDNPRYGKVMVLDNFSSYFTNKLREKHPEIVLSADVFWLVTKDDQLWIWQSLESFVLYFDYVWPMVYPSHYAVWYLWYSVPDNYPYAIIDEAMRFSNKKIDKLNEDIKAASMSWTTLKLKNAFVPNIDVNTIWEIPKSRIRPWFQWFTCTWCKWATAYNREKFRWQVNAALKNDITSWWVWSSSSNYYPNWYNKN